MQTSSTSESSRRNFLQATAATTLGVTTLGVTTFGGTPLAVAQDQDSAKEGKPKYKKSVKYGMVRTQGTMTDKFKLLKELGFDGVELPAPNNYQLEEVLKAQEESGLPVHGVVGSFHWKNTLSHPDEKVRAKGVEAFKTAIQNAKDYGATSVLLVPAVVNKEVSYQDAYTRSQAEIKKVLPMAADLKIQIALENVWNHFLLSPLEFARYIDEFESPWMGAYFDVGNIVNYGWPEQWIRTLGKRIFKVDVKEYSRKKRDDEGLWKGFQAKLLEGDCDWPAVMKAFREIQYEGWFTAEISGGDEKRLAEIAERMNKIFAS